MDSACRGTQEFRTDLTQNRVPHLISKAAKNKAKRPSRLCSIPSERRLNAEVAAPTGQPSSPPMRRSDLRAQGT